MIDENELDENFEEEEQEIEEDTRADEYEELAGEEIEEEEQEAEQEEEEEPEKHSPPPENTVPQSRFNEVNHKAKEQAARIAELEQLLQEREAVKVEEPKQDKSPELKALYKQAKAAVFNDDDDEQYEIIMDKIREIEEGLAEERAIAKMEQRLAEREARTAQKSQQELLDNALNKLIAENPELDSNSEDFNEELWKDVMIFQNGLARQGMAGHLALEKAASKFIKAPEPVVTKQKSKEPDARTQRSVSRGIENSQKAAPNIVKNSTGNRSLPPGIDMKGLNQKKYENLSQEDRDRLKGLID